MLHLPAVRPTALRERFSVAGRPAGLPRGRRLFVLGPRWQNIADTWELAGEKLLRLELPAAYRSEAADHPPTRRCT